MKLKNDPTIANLMHDNVVEKLAKIKGISLDESRDTVSSMSFSQYHELCEASADIPAPSGQTISPSAAAPATQQQPQGKQRMFVPGQPVLPGMTVGVNDATGRNRVPGTVSNVDKATNTVKVMDPKTGQTTTHGINDLGAIAAKATVQPNQQVSQQVGQQMAEELSRLRQLAGIAEDASCGASGAGGIATAPMPMGKVKRRQPVEEVQAKEYTPTVAKTVVGDTKPSQASGELSSTLAANGKKTASRINNGFKK